MIRKYFLVEHEKAILWRRQIKPDIDVRECKVYAGKIAKLEDDHAIVDTPLGRAMLKTDFREGMKLKEGDWVSKHYGYLSEKLSQNHVSKMHKKDRL